MKLRSGCTTFDCLLVHALQLTSSLSLWPIFSGRKKKRRVKAVRAVRRRYNQGSLEGRHDEDEDDDDESQFSPNKRATDRVIEK